MISSFSSGAIASVWSAANKQAESGNRGKQADSDQPPEQVLWHETTPSRVGFWTNRPSRRQCSGMNEFIHTYIHPPGRYADGTLLSADELQEERALAGAVDAISTRDGGVNKAITARSVTPFRLNGIKSVMVGLLCMLAGTGAFPVFRRSANCVPSDDPASIGYCQQFRFEGRQVVSALYSPLDNREDFLYRFPDSSFAVRSSHSVCKSVAEQDEINRESQRLDQWFISQLSKEVSPCVQEKIARDYRSIGFDHGRTDSSSVSLILSGGTRATAQLTKENHSAYARFRGLNYRFVYPFEFREELGVKQLYWMKIFALKNALECDSVPYGQWVVWLDDDIVIDDFVGKQGMLDQYIRHFGHADILVAEDNHWVLINTGVILVKKTELARSFLHLWSLLSNHPWMGYRPQKDTLHEQEVLKLLLFDSFSIPGEGERDFLHFDKIIRNLNLVQVVPNRARSPRLNLNTFKREEFIMRQPWYDHKMETSMPAEEMQQGYEDGDSFIHHGGPQRYRTYAIVESLQRAMDSYSRARPEDEL